MSTILHREPSQAPEHALLRMDSPATSILSRDFLAMKPLIKWLQDVAPGYASGTLIDMGCGNKPYKCFFEQRVQHYVGVDVGQNKFNSVDIIVETHGSLPIRDETVDTVLSTQVLEHVPQPNIHLSEIFRVLKPGGFLILTCPGSFMLHEEPHDYYRFTTYGLRYMLEKCGFNVLRIDSAGGAWRLMGQIFLNHVAFGRKFRVPIVSSIFGRLWTVLVNSVFAALDNINTNEKDTVNYMVAARKL